MSLWQCGSKSLLTDCLEKLAEEGHRWFDLVSQYSRKKIEDIVWLFEKKTVYLQRTFIFGKMGIYINKGNFGFRQIRNSEYVDKTRLFQLARVLPIWC